MKEIIVQVAAYSADYPKAPIYVADLIRCRECKLGGTEDCPMDEIDDEYFCNFGERSSE